MGDSDPGTPAEPLDRRILDNDPKSGIPTYIEKERVTSGYFETVYKPLSPKPSSLNPLESYNTLYKTLKTAQKPQ